MTRIGPRAGAPREAGDAPPAAPASSRGRSQALEAPATMRLEAPEGGRPARGARRASLLDARTEAPPRRTHAARVEDGPEGLVGHVLGDAGDPRPLRGDAAPGAVVLAEARGGALRATGEVLAAPGSARAKLYALAEAEGLSPTFPREVMAEVRALVRNPGLDEPELKDWTDTPFVTIDNPGSRDLDQAMHISRRPEGGYEVRYALADAAYYVRPGSALHAEAMKRGVTHYFPGFNIPMLPPELSEGIVSLNEGEDRRAFAVVTTLDENGEVEGTRFERVKIRSQKQLTYEGVQAYHDGENPALGGQPFTETLELLQEVGDKRRALSSEKDVVQIHREEARATIDPDDPAGFVVSARGRNEVEKWNEQISLLCNAEGAKFLESPGQAPWVTPIYKVHPSPVRKRVEDFAELLAGVVKAHDLDPAVWGWSPDGDASLADYLARLPVEGPQGGIGQAIQRQAVMINRASSFSGAPGEHHGIGVEPYARFSSPMREMVGIHTHKEALEKLSGRPPPGWVRESEASRADMVEVANESQRRQKRLAKAADKLVLDDLLGTDLAAPEADRPVRAGTVLGVSAKKVYMRFDDPPLEVKLYVPDLERAGAKLELSDDRAVLRSSGAELPDIRVGDSLAVKVDGYAADRGRYQLALA